MRNSLVAVLFVIILVMGFTVGWLGRSMSLAPKTITSTQTTTPPVAPTTAAGNWHLDAIAYNNISAGSPIQVSLTHAANCIVFVVVISVNQPNSVGVTSDFTALTYLAQFYQTGLPAVTSYWTTSASAATGTIQVGWVKNQATAVIVAVSFIISGVTSFATENQSVTNWSSGNPSTLTQGAGSNPNRLNVFMAYTFQNATQFGGTYPTVGLDPTLTALTPIAIYEHPLTNYYVAVGWNVTNAQRRYSFSYANSGAVGVAFCGFDPIMSVNAQSQTLQWYSYQQIGSIAVNALPEVKRTYNETRAVPNSIVILVYDYVGVGTGNFSSEGTVVYYTLSHYTIRWPHSENHSNSSFIQQKSYYGFEIAFYAPNQSCSLNLPRSDINCNEILVVNFQNSTSSQTRRYTLTSGHNVTGSWFYSRVTFFDRDPPRYLLSSHLTFLLGTFQGYSWCPVQRVDNVTKLLCEYNPDYGYETISSIDTQGLASAGYFSWRNIALNYSFNHSTGLLKVTVQSGPICDVEKPVSKTNCQGMLLIGFEVTNLPPYSGTPSEIALPLPVGKTETFYLYPTGSNVHQQLYIILGSYVGNYDGVLCSMYSPDSQYGCIPAG